MKITSGRFAELKHPGLSTEYSCAPGSRADRPAPREEGVYTPSPFQIWPPVPPTAPLVSAAPPGLGARPSPIRAVFWWNHRRKIQLFLGRPIFGRKMLGMGTGGLVVDGADDAGHGRGGHDGAVEHNDRNTEAAGPADPRAGGATGDGRGRFGQADAGSIESSIEWSIECSIECFIECSIECSMFRQADAGSIERSFDCSIECSIEWFLAPLWHI